MGNVRQFQALTLTQRLKLFVAGAGKSVFWYVELLIFRSRELIVLASSTIIEDVDAMRKAGLASLAFFYFDFREDQKPRLFCGLIKFAATTSWGDEASRTGIFGPPGRSLIWAAP